MTGSPDPYALSSVPVAARALAVAGFQVVPPGAPHDAIVRVDVARGAARVDDSLAVYENDAEQALRQIVDVVESNAKRKKNEAIAKPFSATVAYAKQTATKAVKTRKKNAEAKASGKAAPAPAKTPTAA